jgi:hypothetical protein
VQWSPCRAQHDAEAPGRLAEVDLTARESPLEAPIGSHPTLLAPHLPAFPASPAAPPALTTTPHITSAGRRHGSAPTGAGTGDGRPPRWRHRPRPRPQPLPCRWGALLPDCNCCSARCPIACQCRYGRHAVLPSTRRPAPCRSAAAAPRSRSIVRPQAVARGSDIVPPFNVVITGGSKGVGRALAARFLREGDSVVICGRNGAPLSLSASSLVAPALLPARVCGPCFQPRGLDWGRHTTSCAGVR